VSGPDSAKTLLKNGFYYWLSKRKEMKTLKCRRRRERNCRRISQDTSRYNGHENEERTYTFYER